MQLSKTVVVASTFMDYCYYLIRCLTCNIYPMFMSITVRSNRIQKQALESDMIYSRDIVTMYKYMFMAAAGIKQQAFYSKIRTNGRQTPFDLLANKYVILVLFYCIIFQQMRHASPWQLQLKLNSILLEERQLKTRFPVFATNISIEEFSLT